MRTPKYHTSLQSSYDIAASTTDAQKMLAALTVIHTEFDAYSLEELVRGFIDRSSVDEYKLFEIWEQAFSGTTNEHGLRLYYNAFLESSDSVRSRYFRNTALTTYINLGSDETRDMTAGYAQQVIDSIVLDDNGFPKYVDYIDLPSVQAGIEQNYDTMDYIISYLVENNDPRAVAHVLHELEGNQRYDDLERFTQLKISHWEIYY